MISTNDKFERFKAFYNQRAGDQTIDFINLDNFRRDLDKHLGVHMNFIDLEIGGSPDEKLAPRFKTKSLYSFSNSVRENKIFNCDKKSSAHQLTEQFLRNLS